MYLGILLIALVGGYLLYDNFIATTPTYEVGIQRGNLIQDLTIPNIWGNETISFSDYRGSVLIIDFMAPWCEPCKFQMPILREVESIPGVEVVTINIDPNYGTEFLTGFKEEEDIRWFFGHSPSTALKFEVNAIPTILVVDQEGKIIYRAYFTSIKDFERILPELID
jgi:thiol-disulfide isomerase/thioredoxin